MGKHDTICREKSSVLTRLFTFKSKCGIVLILVVLFQDNIFAQWRKIFDFGSTNTPVLIHFIDSKIPQVGFVGTVSNYDTAPNNGRLWRTMDGGISWKEVVLPPHSGSTRPNVSSMTFKDDKEGWLCEFNNRAAPIYHTMDGGITWSALQEIEAGAVIFVAQTDRLIATTSTYLAYKFSTDGINFTSQYIPTSGYTVGIAFSDGYSGIMTAGRTSPDPSYFLFTSDGGLTWYTSQQRGEQYSPIGIKGTKLFYAISEADAYFTGQSGQLIRSKDGGMTWETIYHYPNPNTYSLTGALEYNDQALLFQTALDNSEGIMVSEDSGYTFYSLCGPNNFPDTRFFVYDSLIYAGDKYGGLWLNITGIGSNAKPILSDSSFAYLTSVCSQDEKVLRFTLFDSCNGRQAQLLSASATGPAFSLANSLPRTITPDDSVIVHYEPTGAAQDSGRVSLRFKLGWRTFDTTVSLIGRPSVSRDQFFSRFSVDTITTTLCNYSGTQIRFTVKDSCLLEYASLDTVILSGSKRFWTPFELYPSTTEEDDEVSILFNPSKYGADTAFVTLRFSLEGITFDTTVTVIGIYRPLRTALQPVLSDTVLSLQSGCDSIASTLYFYYRDSCIHETNILKILTINSPDFKVLAGPQGDSVKLAYIGLTNERIPMALHFTIGGYDYDTVVYLEGENTSRTDTVIFLPALTVNTIPREQLTEYRLFPSKLLLNKNLSEISFDLTLDADLIEPQEFTSNITGATVNISSTQLPNGFVAYHVRITGADLALDPAQAVLRMPLLTYVTDTVSTPIALSNIQLNSFDPDYERCTLSASSQDTMFTLALLCGDRTIKEFMRHGRSALEITSIHPNPAQDEVRVNFTAQGNEPVFIDVLNVLGQLVDRLENPNQSVTISVKGYMSGMYTVVLHQGGETASSQFVVGK